MQSALTGNSCYLGFLLRYKKNTVYNTVVNEGLVGITGYLNILCTKFTITSSDNVLSALWVGNDGDIEIRMSYRIDLTGLNIYTSVVMKNIGSSSLSSVYCKNFLLLCPNYYYLVY